MHQSELRMFVCTKLKLDFWFQNGKSSKQTTIQDDKENLPSTLRSQAKPMNDDIPTAAVSEKKTEKVKLDF